jgi:predicted transposase YbfD/YdcC
MDCRRPVVDDDKRAAILARRQRGESIRAIAAGVEVSGGSRRHLPPHREPHRLTAALPAIPRPPASERPVTGPSPPWLKAQVMAGLADAGTLVIALDGKTVRGARTTDGKAPHLLAAMITGARAVLAQKDIDAKTNEITQVKPLLDDADITGALVTADAMHVQKETARYLAEDKEADYLFTAVKDNQPGVFAALDALDWENAPAGHTAHHRGHGRDETRALQVLPAPGGLFRCAALAFLTGRTVRDPHDGQLRPAAAAPGVTSRSLQRGGTPAVTAAAARGHWDIEVLQYVRDVSMREDAQRLRAGTSAQVVAAVRNTAVAGLRLAGFTGVAAGRRRAARNPARPLAALTLI